MSKPIPPEAAKQITEFLYGGRKIDAIKLYREHSEQGLKESKDFVEALEAELRAKEPGKFTAPPGGKGCMGILVALGIGSMLAIIAVVMALR